MRSPNPRLWIRASASCGRGELPDRSLLVAHHLPIPIPVCPKLADENPFEACDRAFGELHRGFISHEGVMWPEWLYLEKLKQVIGVHAVFDFAQYMRLGALAIAIGFH